METKSQRLELKDIDGKKGIFTGYFSSFGTVDSYNEIVDFGAFARTFVEDGPGGADRIKAALNHNPYSKLLGKPLKLVEHSFGAYHETKVTMTSYAKDVLMLMEEKVLNEQSFSFETLLDVPARQSPDGKRHLKQVKLWEYGPVVWGANPNTPITGVKSAHELASDIAQLDRHLKSGTLSDAGVIEALTSALQVASRALAMVEAQNPKREVIQVREESDPGRVAYNKRKRQLELMEMEMEEQNLRAKGLIK